MFESKLLKRKDLYFCYDKMFQLFICEFRQKSYLFKDSPPEITVID